MNINRAKFIIAIGLYVFVCQPLGSYAQDTSITITSLVERQNPKIIIRSKYDFERKISLKVKPDPRFLPSDVLIKTISKMGMRDANGVSITSGFDIDQEKDLVLAFSGGTSEIIKSSSSAGGLMITASFKDKKGNFVTPSADNLALYTTSGDKLCFEYKKIANAAPKMAFVLLLDRSGSMKNVITDVRTRAISFLKDLPASSECAVASFNGSFSYHSKYYQSCNNGDFKLDGLKAGGTTDLYTPWLTAYQSLSHEYFKDYQKAVIVITDGQISENKEQWLKLLSTKKDILTFVYFLGQKDDQYLIGLADGFLKNSTDIKTNLGQYFGSLSSAYNSQKVLQVEQCNGGGYAVPK